MVLRVGIRRLQGEIGHDEDSRIPEPGSSMSRRSPRMRSISPPETARAPLQLRRKPDGVVRMRRKHVARRLGSGFRRPGLGRVGSEGRRLSLPDAPCRSIRRSRRRVALADSNRYRRHVHGLSRTRSGVLGLATREGPELGENPREVRWSWAPRAVLPLVVRGRVGAPRARPGEGGRSRGRWDPA